MSRLADQLYRISFLFCFCILLATAGCAGKKTSPDMYEKYTPDEEEIIDVYAPRDDGRPLSPTELAAFKKVSTIDRDLSQEDMQIVELHFKDFVHERRGTFQRFLDRTARYLPYMEETFQRRGIPVELIYIAMAESGGNPNAISHAGAVGLWQFMPFTGRKYGLTQQNSWIDERRDPYKATYAASDYLLKLYSDFSNWPLAMAAYNAGEGKIGRAISGTGAKDFFELCRLDESLEIKARLRTETRDYVPRIIAMAKIMRSLESLGFTRPSPESAYNLQPVSVPAGSNLSALARTLGLTWDEFSSMNPAYRRTSSPPTQTTTAYVPPERLSTATAWLSSPESRSFAGWREYKIQRKDTIAGISKRFKVTQAALKEANNFASLPKVGTTILIPSRGSKQAEPVYEARPAQSGGTATKAAGKYTVQQGDTLFSLAQRWGTDVESIRLANRIGKNSALTIGQRLSIPGNSTRATAPAPRQNSRQAPVSSVAPAAAPSPAPAAPRTAPVQAGGTYTVKSGDTFFSIARAAGCPVSSIYELNNLTSKSALKVGQKLKLPKTGAAAVTNPAPSSRPAAAPVTARPAAPAKPAATAKPAAAAKPAAGKTVTVKKGDTLFSLAKANGVSVDALQKANKITGTSLRLGQKIIIP